jgi:hypothetical protein
VPDLVLDERIKPLGDMVTFNGGEPLTCLA